VRSPADRQYAFAQELYQRGFFDLAAGEFAKFAEQFREDARREAAVFYSAQSLFQSGKGQREATLAALRAYQEEYSEAESQFSYRSFYLIGEIHFQKAEEIIARGVASHEEALPQEAREAYDDALTAYLRCGELWSRRSEIVATALSRAGYCASRLEKWEQAAGAYRRLAESYQSVRAQFMVGETLYRWGQTSPDNFSDAIKAYKQVALFGDNAFEDDAAVGLAWSLYKQAKLDQCRRFLEEEINGGLFSRVDRDFKQNISKLPEVYYLLGLCSSDLGDRTTAVNWFRLLRKHPECAFRKDGLARLGELLGENVDRTTDEGAEVSYAMAQSFMEAGKFSEAAAEFERLYRSYPKMATAGSREHLLYDWGTCYERLGYYREALAILGYLSRRSSDVPVRRKAARAEALCRQGLAKEANDALSKRSEELEAIAALKRYADSSIGREGEEALTNVADFYYDREMYARASRVYEEFLSRFPRSPRGRHVLLRLGQCSLKTERPSAGSRKAISFFKECQNEYPMSVQAVFATEQLAVLFAKMSEYEASLAEYSRLQAESFAGLSGEDMEVCEKVFENAAFARGIVRERFGDLAGAVSELELLLLQYPSSPKVEQTRLRLARLYFDQSQYEDSLRVLRPYSEQPEKCPDLEVALVLLVRSLLRLGRDADTIGRITEVFESQPGARLPPTAFARMSRIMESEGQVEGARLPYSLLIERQRKLHDAMVAAEANTREMVEKSEYAKAVDYSCDIFAIHAPEKAAELKNGAENMEKGTREKALLCLQTLEEVMTEARSILRTGLWELGELNLRLGDPASAAKAFESLAAIKPPTKQHFDVLFKAGSAWKKSREVQKALRDFEEIVRLASKPADSLRAQLAIGDMWLESGNAKRSLGTYLRIINFYDAESPAVRPWVARALFQSGVAFEKLRRMGDARRQYEVLVRDFSGEAAFNALVEEAKRRLGEMKSAGKTDAIPSS